MLRRCHASAFLWVIALSGLAIPAHSEDEAGPGENWELEPGATESLRSDLLNFFVIFTNGIEVASRQEASDNPQKQEHIILGSIASSRVCRAAVFQEDPLRAFLDTWGFIIRAQQYLESPEARRRWGDSVESFQSLFQGFQTEVGYIASNLLPPDAVNSIRESFEDWSRQNPLDGIESLLRDNKSAANIPGVSWVLKLPSAPFKTMKGVDLTAHAAIRLGTTLDMLSRSLSTLPIELTWEAELTAIRTAKLGHELIDHAFWRLAQLMLTLFAFAVVWRFLLGPAFRRRSNRIH